MPDEGVVVTMIAHSLSMSRDKYLLTRTREQFLADSHALMKSQLMTVEVIASMFSGDGKSDAPPSLPDDYVNPGEDLRNAKPEANGNHWEKAGPEMSDRAAGDWARRAARSSKKYGWYKTSPNRRYNVVNLDTRDPNQFRKNIRKFGDSR